MYTALATQCSSCCVKSRRRFRTAACQPEECKFKLRDTGTLPDFRVTTEHEVNHDVDNQGNVIRLDYCVWEWMKGIIYGVNVGTARSHFGCDRMNQKESVEAAKINERCSQPSGEVQGGCVLNFLNPGFSTGRCINSRQFH